MASSAVGKSLVCFRTINNMAYCDGSAVNIGLQKLRLVIALSGLSSGRWDLLPLVIYASRGSSC